MFRLAGLAALVLALVVAAPADAAFVGQQRLLVVLVTWGPEPFSAAAARSAVLEEADVYLRSASFGRAWISGESLGWVHALDRRPDGCGLNTVEAAAEAQARAHGLDPTSFDRLVIGMPEIDCPWGGAYFGGQVWANGYLNRNLVVHELGHLHGVPEEGPAWVCGGGRCDVNQYGDPYSVMGHGSSDYSAFEQLVFGWLEQERVTPGEHELGAIDRVSASPRGLFVTTAGDEYAFEYRPPEPRLPYELEDATPGVVVHGGPNGLPVGPPSRFPARNLLVADPARRGRPSIQAGETFSAPGAFAVTVLEAAPDAARIRFAWTDRVRPGKPRILSAGRRLAWRPSRERGSGVELYELRVDRRPVRRFGMTVFAGALDAGRLHASLGRLSRGRHRVSVTAVDRAGNRSLPAVRTFRVR